MTVSLRRMSAGSGYRYLLRSVAVAVGDGNRSMSTPLTRYYSEAGTPPGRWLGSGVRMLAGGRLAPGMVVSEEQLALLIGMGRDPVTGEQLGRAYPSYKPLAQRISERVVGLDPEMTLEDCAAETTRIEAEETAMGRRHAVAGFDLTFSVPKSVSVLWGVADAPLQDRIVGAHHAAVVDVLDFLEREVAATRTGVSDGDGAVAQVDVAGVAAVAYDHYDSRAGDPQLHTHVVVSNKVLTLLDQRWRSLDSRPVHASVTGLSAHYNALLADRLTRELGIEWESRQRGPDRNPQWEIVGVSEELIGEFSSRSREINLEKDRLIADYRTVHGRMPSQKKIVELRAQATLATRPPKQVRSLADLTTDWRRRAEHQLAGANSWRDAATAWAGSLIDARVADLLRVEDVPLAAVQAVAADVVATVSETRSTWTHWNLMAEASRRTMGLRFATTTDRETAIAMVLDAAQAMSVALTPPEVATNPSAFRRLDGTSVFRPKHAVRYSSVAVLDAEARLLERADATGAPTACFVHPTRADPTLSGIPGVGEVTTEQRVAIESVAASGRQVDVLVGPAGAGKTTTMRALRQVWVAAHGPRSVVGLAPSATAAQALADDLGVVCDNTVKWLFEHDRANQAYGLRAGQLLIVDEATLAGTRILDRLTSIAATAGAKVLLVGDPHQLQSVDAGGAFALLVARRADPATLSTIHRFTHDWEKTASLQLSRGDVEVISTYAREDRIREGDTAAMLDAAYQAWRADTHAGRASILLTDSANAVRTLNERARAERLSVEDAFDAHEVHLADGLLASVGDLVITRRNDRTLRTMSNGWVKNGDRWLITDIRNDGSVVVGRYNPHGHQHGLSRGSRGSRGRQGSRGSAVLPAEYVAQHVDLGYAITAHRAQGMTVDTAHVVVSAATTRENLYVSMTRGRDTNTAYVALDQPDDSHTTPEPVGVNARTVLYGVLQHGVTDLSAHQTIEAEYTTYTSIARIAAELETHAAAAQHDRFADLLRRSGLSDQQHAAVTSSTAFGPLTAALRRAEAYHHDLDQLVPGIVAQHGLEDANDVAAVLRYRLEEASVRPPHGLRHAAPRLIAGLVPEPLGPMSEDDRQAVSERKHLIETQARDLAQQALASNESWTRRLGTPPSDEHKRDRWFDALATVAAYRSRYAITSSHVLGPGADSDSQRADRKHALVAARAAAQIASPAEEHRTPTAQAPALSTP